MHPFARARERTRALNAAKMERMFAQPFVASLEGHVDAVETMARKPDTLDIVASGSWDGGAFASTVLWTKTRVGYIQPGYGCGFAGRVILFPDIPHLNGYPHTYQDGDGSEVFGHGCTRIRTRAVSSAYVSGVGLLTNTCTDNPATRGAHARLAIPAKLRQYVRSAIAVHYLS